MRITTLRLAAAVALGAGALAVPATYAAAVPCGGGTTLSPPAAPWSHDFGTGEDYGVKHAVTSVDPQWVVAPANGPTYSVTPNSAWVTHPNANWINDKATASGGGGTGGVSLDVTVDPRSLTEPLKPLVDTSGAERVLDQAGVTPAVSLTVVPTSTRFRHYFTVPQNSYGHSIALQFAADNGVDFFLDATPIGGFNPPVPSSGIPLATPFNQLHTLNWAGVLTPGQHYLDAVVTDYGVAKGLLVIGGVSGCVVKEVPGTCVVIRKDGLGYYSYSPAPYDLGTGESGYTPFAPGTVDDDWTTVAPAPGPAYAVATYPGWVGSTTSSWINRSPDARRDLGGSRTYEVQFPLSAGSYNTLLDIRYAADNDVVFRLNGVPIGGFVQGPVPAAFNQLHSLTYAGPLFQPGTTNVLTAEVTDYGVATGLLVEGGVRSCEKGPLP
jgi:hypothetical protein